MYLQKSRVSVNPSSSSHFITLVLKKRTRWQKMWLNAAVRVCKKKRTMSWNSSLTFSSDACRFFNSHGKSRFRQRVEKMCSVCGTTRIYACRKFHFNAFLFPYFLMKSHSWDHFQQHSIRKVLRLLVSTNGIEQDQCYSAMNDATIWNSRLRCT